jgi:SAM-dependent methyltransferase
VLAAFTITTFANAALLFLLEPLFSKQVLPALGGSSAVWTTCMMSYQGILLAGYVYVHLGTRWLGVRRHAAAHMLLLGASLWFLPVSLAPGWTPPAGGTPVFWLLGLLLASIGLPFFCLSAGAPLLQRWFAGTGHPRRADPYFLYAASNAGSMLALVAYPLMVEPLLPIRAQSTIWSAAFVALGLAAAACAVVVWRAPALGAESAPAASGEPGIAWRRRWGWLALSAVPSSLLLGVTAHLSTDVAPVPLLWVVPLTLYLVTFVWAFSPRRRSQDRLARVLRLLALPLVLMLALGLTVPLPAMVLWELTVFTLIAAVCHARLASDRPGVDHLTEYYVWMSLGGLLGGVFNALVAPSVFAGLYEYPAALAAGLGLAAAPLVRDAQTRPWWKEVALAAAVGAGSLGVASLATSTFAPGNLLVRFVLAAAGGLVLLACAERPLRLALTSAAVYAGIAAARSAADGTILHARSFYGAYQVQRAVIDGRPMHMLVHGSTIHGAQFRDSANAKEPLTYYARSGPIGDAFASLPARIISGRIAAVGLGTGSLACYAQPAARWTFLEIDPMVVHLAASSGQFDYLRRCAPGAPIQLGDARIVLSRAPDRQYDLLVLDAFTSDAVPTHLLTREAFREYVRVLAPGGVLLVHVSNRHLRLDQVVQAGALDAGMVAWVRESAPSLAERKGMITPARWIVLARDAQSLGTLTARDGWQSLATPPVSWRDDFSNVIGIMKLPWSGWR